MNHPGFRSKNISSLRFRVKWSGTVEVKTFQDLFDGRFFFLHLTGSVQNQLLPVLVVFQYSVLSGHFPKFNEGDSFGDPFGVSDAKAMASLEQVAAG